MSSSAPKKANRKKAKVKGPNSLIQYLCSLLKLVINVDDKNPRECDSPVNMTLTEKLPGDKICCGSHVKTGWRVKLPVRVEDVPVFLLGLFRERLKSASSARQVTLMVSAMGQATIVAKQYNDEFVSVAVERLPQIACFYIVKALDTAVKPDDFLKVTREETALEALLMCMSGSRDAECPAMSRDMWEVLVDSCKQHKTTLLRSLLATGSNLIDRNLHSPHKCKSVVKALMMVCCSPCSTNVMATILSKEAEQARSHPSSFLRNTELGRLISLPPFNITLAGSLLNDIGKKPFAQALLSLRQDIQELVAEVLSNVLMDTSWRQSARTWMWTVIGKNTIRGSYDLAYILNFGAAVFYVYEKLEDRDDIASWLSVDDTCLDSTECTNEMTESSLNANSQEEEETSEQPGDTDRLRPKSPSDNDSEAKTTGLTAIRGRTSPNMLEAHKLDTNENDIVRAHSFIDLTTHQQSSLQIQSSAAPLQTETTASSSSDIKDGSQPRLLENSLPSVQFKPESLNLIRLKNYSMRLEVMDVAIAPCVVKTCPKSAVNGETGSLQFPKLLLTNATFDSKLRRKIAVFYSNLCRDLLDLSTHLLHNVACQVLTSNPVRMFLEMTRWLLCASEYFEREETLPVEPCFLSCCQWIGLSNSIAATDPEEYDILCNFLVSLLLSSSQREDLIKNTSDAIQRLCIRLLERYRNCVRQKEVSKMTKVESILMRSAVELLKELWPYDEYRQWFSQQCHTEEFQDFLTALCRGALDLFEAAWIHVEVKKVEDAEKPGDPSQQTAILLKQKSLWLLFIAHLALLENLTSEEKIAKSFRQFQTSQSAIALMSVVLDKCYRKGLLVPPKNCSEFQSRVIGSLESLVRTMLNITKQTDGQSNPIISRLVNDCTFEIFFLNRCRKLLWKCDLMQDNLSALDDLIQSLEWQEREMVDRMHTDKFSVADYLKTIVNEDVLTKDYQARLRKVFLGEEEHSDDGVYEVEVQGTPLSLPIHPDCSVFVLPDPETPGVYRCMLSGMKGTPYSRGLIAFDVRCSVLDFDNPFSVEFVASGFDRYFVQVAEKMKEVVKEAIESNHDSQHKTSTTTEQLLRLILDTSCLDGNSTATWEAERFTICHAMLDCVRNPFPGWEDVIREHFLVLRDAILKQCAEWISSCLEETHRENLVWDVTRLYYELKHLARSSPMQDTTNHSQEKAPLTFATMCSVGNP